MTMLPPPFADPDRGPYAWAKLADAEAVSRANALMADLSAQVAASTRETSVHDVLAGLLDDDTLTMRLHRPHWQLEDPWLDASIMIAEHDVGRHRNGIPVINLGAVPDRRQPARHICHCDRCQVASFVGIATAYRSLDNTLGGDVS